MPALTPITEEDYLTRVAELFEKSKEDGLARAKQLWHSGALGNDEYPDNYVLPKLFMISYASRFKEAWMPNGEKVRRRWRTGHAIAVTWSLSWRNECQRFIFQQRKPQITGARSTKRLSSRTSRTWKDTGKPSGLE